MFLSQTRNKNLANIFYRLKHIEAYGTGIQRIFDLYKEGSVQPDIIITDNTFTMVLPNRNADTQKEKITVSAPATGQEQHIIDYIKKNGSITDDEIQAILGVKKSRAYAIIKSMKNKGVLLTKGRGNDKKHYLK